MLFLGMMARMQDEKHHLLNSTGNLMIHIADLGNGVRIFGNRILSASPTAQTGKNAGSVTLIFCFF